MKRHEVDEWKNYKVKINGTVINVDAHEQGFYTDGDTWGVGIEPPDYSVEITEVRYKADGITEAQVREALEYGEVIEMNKEELKPIDVTKFTITESGNVLRSKTMKEELLKKLHTAMCNDNEHQSNRLNNYIHTDEYLTAEVVQVVNEIIAEETKELKAQNKELTLKISRLESDCDAYNYSQRTYQEEIKELKAENEQIKNSDTLCKLIGEQKRKITELEAQIKKMKCCENCKYRELIKEHGQWKERLNCKGNGCVLHSKWVMRNF